MRIRHCLVFLVLVCASSFASDDRKPAQASTADQPTGSLPAASYISGVRASSTLATVVHCSNISGDVVTFEVDFYEYDGTFKCATIAANIAAGTTRTLATANSAAFLEDQVCATPPAIGQGSAIVRVAPVGARLACSAQIVSIAGDPPTTLGALDIHPVR